MTNGGNSQNSKRCFKLTKTGIKGKTNREQASKYTARSVLSVKGIRFEKQLTNVTYNMGG
jgi:hypothetical protein